MEAPTPLIFTIQFKDEAVSLNLVEQTETTLKYETSKSTIDRETNELVTLNFQIDVRQLTEKEKRHNILKSIIARGIRVTESDETKSKKK